MNSSPPSPPSSLPTLPPLVPVPSIAPATCPDTTPEPVPARPWGPWATLGGLLAVLILWAGVQFIVGIGFAIVIGQNHGTHAGTLHQHFKAIEGLAAAVGILVSSPLLVLFIILLCGVRSLPVLDYLGIRPVRTAILLRWLGYALGLLVVTGVLAHLARRPTPSSMLDLYRHSVWPALLALAVIVAAPLWEEVVFRGFVLKGLLQSRLGDIGAVVVTAAIFSIIHVGQYEPFELIVVGLLGILLGAARVTTGSIAPCLLIHMAWNGVGFAALALNAAAP